MNTSLINLLIKIAIWTMASIILLIVLLITDIMRKDKKIKVAPQLLTIITTTAILVGCSMTLQNLFMKRPSSTLWISCTISIIILIILISITDVLRKENIIGLPIQLSTITLILLILTTCTLVLQTLLLKYQFQISMITLAIGITYIITMIIGWALDLYLK